MSGHIAALLVGSKLRTVGVVVLALGVVAGGGVAVGVLGTPSVGDVENRFGAVNDSTTTIHTDLVVSNPNPVGVSLGGVTVSYDVRMNGVKMAEGSKAGVAVESGESTLSAETEMRNERISTWWRSHVENGEHSEVSVDATVRSSTLGRAADAPNVTRSVDTEMLAAFNSSETREVNANAPVVSDPVMYVNRTNASWGDVDESVTPLELRFVVYNPKPYPVTVSKLGYDIAMNDVAVGNGTTESEYVVAPKSTKTIEATTYVRNERLDEWWVTHLERNQVTDLRIDFAAQFDVGGGRTVDVPLDPLTYEETIETDIFGTKNGTAPTNGTDSGESETTTPADEETAEPPETTTAADSGGLLGGDSPDSEERTATPAETTAPTPTATTTPAETDDRTTTDDGLFAL
ncbi:LEA14-like dessication related protein [Halopelagius inordinatus]|uniref:LEA14-like dessication related protein n=1 Tax=Halopelagius inordinatus TaxID=553467 RepID=A0A1I2NPV5_9EURY|nr:LEA type 2 family protein [Halopelagius inordinatus]SFG05892.1 LEA14-like dessication related protein [Halopelagius inordinatus]